MKKFLIFIALVLLVASSSSYAAMSNFVTYTAEGAGISIDALGIGDYTTGTLQAEIPVGAEIYRAYLYSASVWSSGLSNVEFQGGTLISNASSRLDTGAKNANSASENRWDVTSQVTSLVGGGSGTFNFNVKELGYLDGEILAVVYKVAGNPVNTAFIFDGELSTSGDSFNVNLTTPYSTTDTAIMSLGISYGYQGYGDQYTQVDINGTRLTTSAGGNEDGGEVAQNGYLITAGGVGDSIANPANPYATPPYHGHYDDELYNIGTLLSNGTNVITLSTLNPSADDNVFFMGLTVRGEAVVPQIPEPGTMMLLGSLLMGMVGLKKVRN
ncbi:MAG: PEP-CTERM sorting domain-containing protein [bacterium]